MEPTQPRATALRFGVFEVDRESGELRKNGLKVPLQEQPFRVLTLLLENAGKVVTRDELQQTLWPADTFVEFDRGLNTAINKVREALGDSATSSRFVETVPRRGYRFLAPVEGLAQSQGPDRVPASEPSPAHLRRRVWQSAIAGLLAGLVAGAILWRQFSRPATVPNLPLRKLAITPMGMTTGVGPMEKMLAISPDGHYVVSVLESGSPPKRALSLYNLEKGQWQELPGTEGANRLFWSPGSDFVGFFVAGDLKKVPIHGGPTITVCGVPGGIRIWTSETGGTWSSDGDEIVFCGRTPSGRNGLYSVPSVGGSTKLLVPAGPGPTESVYHPLLLPSEAGNRALLCLHYLSESGPSELHLLDSSGRRRILPRDEGATISYLWPVYSPTGHLIYGRCLSDNLSDIWAVPFSLRLFGGIRG